MQLEMSMNFVLFFFFLNKTKRKQKEKENRDRKNSESILNVSPKVGVLVSVYFQKHQDILPYLIICCILLLKINSQIFIESL